MTTAAVSRADAIRIALTLLASPAPGYEFGRGRTWIERVHWALAEAQPHNDATAHWRQRDCPGCNANALWHDLEDIAGRLEEIARNVRD